MNVFIVKFALTSSWHGSAVLPIELTRAMAFSCKSIIQTPCRPCFRYIHGCHICIQSSRNVARKSCHPPLSPSLHGRRSDPIPCLWCARTQGYFPYKSEKRAKKPAARAPMLAAPVAAAPVNSDIGGMVALPVMLLAGADAWGWPSEIWVTRGAEAWG